jgi:hypothetical protein
MSSPNNHDTDIEEEYYDKLYFDSDTTDEEKEETEASEAFSKGIHLILCNRKTLIQAYN